MRLFRPVSVFPLVILPSVVVASTHHARKTGDPALGRRDFVSGSWSLVQLGTTGVSAMQLAVVSETKAIIYDKIENNPLQVNGHAAWAAELDLNTQAVRALNPATNSFCATGSFLSNGTFINSGGTDAQNANGLQGIRLFTPCNTGACDVFENPTRIRLTSNRWYPSSARLQDGSIIIYGGSIGPDFINRADINNPTYEFYPSKNINGFNGVQIPSQFLIDTLNGNHFPNMVLLPSGDIFISANQAAMILNWQTNTETRLPSIPGGVHISSPFSAGHVLLPLGPSNNYTPEILICGGSTVSDQIPANTISAQRPTSDQCIRILLSPAGIAAGWQVEQMPEGRIMPDMILLPDGRVMLVGGAKTGVAGYGNVGDQIGQSNADNPSDMPLIYDPAAPAGSRFSTDGLVASPIPRMYHSTATLTPNGTIMLAGSNPNGDVETRRYATEYRLEFYSPPYISRPRPIYTGLPQTINYGTSFTLEVTLPSNTTGVNVVLMDLGFATHGVHMDQRLLHLTSTLSTDQQTLVVSAPIANTHYPPGPAFLYVVTDQGVPSFGHKTVVGTGASPPVDQGAIANMLAQTSRGRVGGFTKPATGEGSETVTIMA